MAGSNVYQLQDRNGFEVIADTSPHTNNDDGFYKLVVLTTAVIDTIEGANLTNKASLEGVSLPVNFEVSGDFSSVTLTSGAVIAYKRG